MANNELQPRRRRRAPRIAAALSRSGWGGLLGGDVVQLNRWWLHSRFVRLGLQSQRAELAGGSLHYYRGGHGAPLLMIHGFGCGALETWDRQVSPLSARYELIAPDLFWFGRSLPRAESTMTTAAAQADALAQLLGRLEIARTHVLGISFGGFVALQLARRHAHLLDRLVLVCPAGLQPTPEEEKRMSAAFGDPADVSDVLVPPDPDALQRFLQTVFYRPPKLPRFVLRQLLKREFWHHAAAKRAICRALPQELLRPDELAGIRARTLLLWGRHDPLVPLTLGHRMCKALPRAQLVAIPRAAHPVMLEQPELFNRAVIEFLRA